MYMALVCKVTVFRNVLVNHWITYCYSRYSISKRQSFFIIYIEGWARKKKRFRLKTIESCEISKKWLDQNYKKADSSLDSLDVY